MTTLKTQHIQRLRIQGEGALDGDVLFVVENVEGGPRCAFT